MKLFFGHFAQPVSKILRGYRKLTTWNRDPFMNNYLEKDNCSLSFVCIFFLF